MINETGDINGIKVGLKCFIVFETTHALQNIEAEIVIYLYVKAVQLIKKDGEIFIEPVCKKNPTFKQSLGLPCFI